MKRWRARAWWHARFFWQACLQRDFEDERVQRLVDEHFARFYLPGRRAAGRSEHRGEAHP